MTVTFSIVHIKIWNKSFFSSVCFYGVSFNKCAESFYLAQMEIHLLGSTSALNKTRRTALATTNIIGAKQAETNRSQQEITKNSIKQI